MRTYNNNRNRQNKTSNLPPQIETIPDDYSFQTENNESTAYNHQNTMEMMPPLDDTNSASNSNTHQFDNRPRTKKGKLKCIHKGRAITTGILVSCILTVGTMALYYNFITYPPIEKRDEDTAGLGAIRRLNLMVKSRDFETLAKEINDTSYMSMEREYANSDEDIISFMNNVFGTVKYTPRKVEGKNIYGNTMIDKQTQDVVYVESLVNSEKDIVDLSFIDYTKIKFNDLEIQNFLKTNNISTGSADYNNQVINVFCKYMNSLNWTDLATKTIERTPSLTTTREGMKIAAEEDIYLDKLLFSSEDFYDLLYRFDLAANGGEIPVTQDWDKWSKLKDKEKAKTEEPKKYSDKYRISRYWCGAYYLQKEHTNEKGELVPILPQSGDGTFDKPAAIGTSVLTNLITLNKDKKAVAYPIRVELVDIMLEGECHEWLAEKDTRNRGLDESSHNRYAALRFQITNLSDDKLVVPDNSSLADQAGNLSARTGNMYGLKSKVTLEPGQSDIIETWVASTELDRKYLIWGADFQKKAPIVYFGVLNAEDKVEQKDTNANDSTESDNAETETKEE